MCNEAAIWNESVICEKSAAAELYESIDAAREAVNCYIAGEVWDKARMLAQQMAPDMVRVVEDRYKSELINKRRGPRAPPPEAGESVTAAGESDGDELIRRTGDVDSASGTPGVRSQEEPSRLDMYARNGDWTKPRAQVQYCKILANKGDNLEAEGWVDGKPKQLGYQDMSHHFTAETMAGCNEPAKES
eukprot:Skav206506  [mRNA]  locus=scaffold2251:32131:36476:- [translate_table: standard]